MYVCTVYTTENIQYYIQHTVNSFILHIIRIIVTSTAHELAVNVLLYIPYDRIYTIQGHTVQYIVFSLL